MPPQKTGKGLIRISDCIVGLRQTMQKSASTKTSSGLRSHFYDLDNLTGSFAPASLTAIAGRSQMDISVFALAIAANVAKYGGKSVAYFTIGRPKVRLTQQLLAQESNISLSKISNSKITEQECDGLIQAIALLPSVPLFVDDTPHITVDDIRAALLKLQSQGLQKELGLVVIDRLQLIGGSSALNRTEELSKIIRSFKRLAKELSVPILMLSEINKSVDLRANKRPRLTDISNCGSIEDVADLVLLVHSENYYKSYKSEQEIIEIIVAKNRNGAGDTIKLLYKPNLAQFRNLAK